MTATEANDDRSLPRVGVKGVRLKKYEEAVADILLHVTPCFSKLPPLPSSSGKEWPFDCLPPAARVTGDKPGKLKGARAVRKEGQLRSLLRCVVAMLPEEYDGATIVDFCGGTGHLALPLALLLPHCKVVVVDIGSRSLHLLHEKALGRGITDSGELQDSSMSDAVQRQKKDVTYQEQIERQCVGIPNLYSFHGSIETYLEKFDIGVALHACGEASDMTLRACARVGASFVVSPCCVGKLHRQRMNPYIYHATAGNVPTISYPQSTIVQGCLREEDLWNDLAKAADYGDLMEVRTPRNATRRTAKALLETDRLLFMKEQYGYKTALTRMDPWKSSTKNDILLGWFENDGCFRSPFHKGRMTPDDDCNADIEISKQQLFESIGTDPYCQPTSMDGVDWTWQEEEDMRKQLTDFVKGGERKWILPAGMGARKRKMVHCVAEHMGLVHWCHGKTKAEKTVAVAKRHRIVL